MPPTPADPNRARFGVLTLLLAMVALGGLQELWSRLETVAAIPYSRFHQLLEQKKVEKVLVGADDIRGQLKEPLDGKKEFITNRVDLPLAEDLAKYGVTFSA